MRLSPFHVRPDRTLWLDPWSGAGVSPDSRALPLRTAPGALMPLRDVLQLVEDFRATRVMLTGERVGRAWFLTPLEHPWSHGSHHLDHETPTGRYRHALGADVEVRRTAEWFGAGDYSPRTAAEAWEAAGVLLSRTHRTGAALMRSPGATGRDLWLRAAGGEVPDPLPEDLQALIRSTSPQHRIEVMPAFTPTVPGVWILDGRFMYAALTNGLGSGPVTMLTGRAAREAFEADPFGRARYRVRFAAPRSWAAEAPHAPGLFLARAGDLASDGWHCPMAGETWADAAEVDLAVRCGWAVTFLEGIRFTPGRPLDAWAARLVKAREQATDDKLGDAAPLVRSAVRSILLHGIGAFHSSGQDETTVTRSPMVAPDGDGWDAPDVLENGTALWRRRRETTNPRSLAMAHPEWSSQVWGRAHARILRSPTSDRSVSAGILGTELGETMAVYGDALMTSRRPRFADLDDGKVGRLRVKGHLCGPVPWPTNARERDELTHAAEAAGTTCERGCA